MARKVALALGIVAVGWALAVAAAPILAPSLASAMLFLTGQTSPAATLNTELPPIGTHTIPSHIAYAVSLLSGDGWWVFLLVFVICCTFLLMLVAYARTLNPTRYVKNGVFETGEVCASRQEIVRRCYVWDGESPTCYGMAAGCIKGRVVVFPATHAVCIAPSGSGKTRRSLYETADLLTYEGDNSIVVTDPSGEVHAMLREGLEQRGYSVRLISLDDVSGRGGDRFNPLCAITGLYQTGDHAPAEARAREIGDILCPEQGNENDIFARGAGGVIAATAYLVATLDRVPNDCRHLWSVVKTVLAGTTSGADRLKDWLRQFGEDSPAVAMAATFLSSDGKLESGILSSLHDALQPFTSMHLKWLTSASDFSVNDLMTDRTALFVRMLPPGNQANKLVSLMLSQYVNEMLRQGDRSALRPVYVLADEAHAIPKFDLVTAVEQGRKYKSHWYLWLQSNEGLDQYKTTREDGKSAVLANADVKILYKAGTRTDAEMFSVYGGERTVISRNTGTSRNAQGGTSNEGYSENKALNWPTARILSRDPQKDGALVVASITGETQCSGCFEIPMADVTETPTAKNFPTFGTREHENAVLAEEGKRLSERAKERRTDISAWIPPEFAYANDESEDTADDEFGLWK